MALSLTVGTVIGVLSGYFRRLDGPLMRFTDLFLALPVLPLLMVSTMLFREPLRAALGLEAGIFFLIVGVIGITSWMQTARIVRGQVLTIRAREYVVAARSVGARPWRIIVRHVFPNALSPILVAATLDIAQAIITESALSFLGLGFPSDFPTWGRPVRRRPLPDPHPGPRHLARPRHLPHRPQRQLPRRRPPRRPRPPRHICESAYPTERYHASLRVIESTHQAIQRLHPHRPIA